MTTALRSLINTIIGLVGYYIPVLLGSGAPWLNLTIGGIILWAYNHYIAPKMNTGGLVGVIKWQK